MIADKASLFVPIRCC